MRYLITFLISLSTVTNCLGQFDKLITFTATTNLNIALQGLAMNDVGAGLGLDASFFSKNKLQALVETNADHFIGDKQLLLDPVTGKSAKNAAVYSIKAGLQFFIKRNLAVAATYGPSWHIVKDFEYSFDDGFKYSLIGFFGSKRHLVAKVFFVNIPVDNNNIQYLGIGAGLRF